MLLSHALPHMLCLTETSAPLPRAAGQRGGLGAARLVAGPRGGDEGQTLGGARRNLVLQGNRAFQATDVCNAGGSLRHRKGSSQVVDTHKQAWGSDRCGGMCAELSTNGSRG